MENEVIITKTQLEQLLSYYKLYGVEEMKFQKDDLQETLETYAVSPLKIQFQEQFGCCSIPFHL
jgi:hypothetical protein